MTTWNELQQLAAELERCGLRDATEPAEQLLVQRLVDLASSLGADAPARDALVDPRSPSVVRERAAVALIATARRTANRRATDVVDEHQVGFGEVADRDTATRVLTTA